MKVLLVFLISIGASTVSFFLVLLKCLFVDAKYSERLSNCFFITQTSYVAVFDLAFGFAVGMFILSFGLLLLFRNLKKDIQ